MTRVSRSSLATGLIVLAWSPALAQTPSAPPDNTQSAAFVAYEDLRPTTTTFLGERLNRRVALVVRLQP